MEDSLLNGLSSLISTETQQGSTQQKVAKAQALLGAHRKNHLGRNIGVIGGRVVSTILDPTQLISKPGWPEHRKVNTNTQQPPG